MASPTDVSSHPHAWRWEGKGVFHQPFKRLILLLPVTLRYWLTLIAFWPTALIARCYAYLFPHKRRVWDRIDGNVILGAAPFLRSEIEQLYHKEHVRGICNLCREWDWHRNWYQTVGITQLWLPTVDFDCPIFEDLVAGALFIHDAAKKGPNNTVYVHCKAGRSRSTAVVLAYLILFKGMEPLEAHLHVKAKRQHINERHKAPEVLRCWALRQELMTGGYSLQSYEQMLRRIAAQGDTEVLQPTRSHEAADAAAAAKGKGIGGGEWFFSKLIRRKPAKEGKLA
jgi:atypical dual specificity phosphatase